MKQVMSPNTDPIVSIEAIAKKKFLGLATELMEKELISKYEIRDVEWLEIILYRQLDHKQISLGMLYSTEVFYHRFDVYTFVSCAYDMEDKVEVLDDLIDCAQVWLDKTDYYEEFYEKGDRVIYKRLIDSRYGVTRSASMVRGGWFRRFFGCKKRIVRPQGR